MFLRSVLAAVVILTASCSGESPALREQILHPGLDASVMAGRVVEIGQVFGYSARVKDSESMMYLTQGEPAFYVFLEKGTKVVATIGNAGFGETIHIMIFASGEPDGDKRARLLAALMDRLSADKEGET